MEQHNHGYLKRLSNCTYPRVSVISHFYCGEMEDTSVHKFLFLTKCN